MSRFKCTAAAAWRTISSSGGTRGSTRASSNPKNHRGAACISPGPTIFPSALAALVGRSRLVVCNDTGLSHVAAAMRTPSVVIASGSDTHRWAPLDHERHRVLADYPPCRPCSFRECPYGHPCALAIDAQQVLDTARMQLNRYASQPL